MQIGDRIKHGEVKPLLRVFQYMDNIDRGVPDKAHRNLFKYNNEFLNEDGTMTELGKEVLDKVRVLLPLVFKRDGLSYEQNAGTGKGIS